MINSASQVSEIERSIPPNREPYVPPKIEVKEWAVVEPPVEKPDPEQLRKILAESNISLHFRRDETSGRLVVEMIDNTTGDPVRQIPSEVSLRLSEFFSKIQGRLFEARV